MKPSNLVLLGVVIAALSTAGECLSAGQATQPSRAEQPPQAIEPLFTLALSAVQGTVASGSPVNARVVTTNTSGREIHFMWDTPPKFYQVDVHDGSGNAPPDTWVRRMCRTNEENSPNGPVSIGMSMAKLRLKPGAASTDVIDLGTWYDFSQPGTYTIQVRRRAEEAGTMVTSNPITITVVPGETPQSLPPSPPPASQPPFSLTLWTSPRATSFPLGNVWFDVITENISDHKIFLRTETSRKEQAGSIYKIDITDDRGGMPLPTEFGRASDIRGDTPPPPASATPREAGESLRLLPGEKWSDFISLHNLYRIQEPGQYTIQVRRWDDETKTWVKSNTIRVTVTP
jgi:hypothetical protein